MIFKNIIGLFKRVFKKRRKPARKNIKRASKPRARIRRRSKFHIKRKHKKIIKNKFSKKTRIKKNFKKSLKRKSEPKRIVLKKSKSFKTVSCGIVTHYFPKVNAAVVKVKKALKLGDPILIKGNTTDFRQMVSSMQIDRRVIEKAKPGMEIGLEVLSKAMPGDEVFIVKG